MSSKFAEMLSNSTSFCANPLRVRGEQEANAGHIRGKFAGIFPKKNNFGAILCKFVTDTRRIRDEHATILSLLQFNFVVNEEVTLSSRVKLKFNEFQNLP